MEVAVVPVLRKQSRVNCVGIKQQARYQPELNDILPQNNKTTEQLSCHGILLEY